MSWREFEKFEPSLIGRVVQVQYKRGLWVTTVGRLAIYGEDTSGKVVFQFEDGVGIGVSGYDEISSIKEAF